MIRPAAPDDIDASVGLTVATEMFGADEAEPVAQMLAAHFDQRAEDAHGFVVDVDEQEVVGVAYYQPKPATDRAWELTMIAVAPDRQGDGRGRALLEHVEEALRADGQRLLLVETSGLPQYDRTRAFYDGCGYDEVARVADYWTTGDDLVLFRKCLS